MEYSERHNLEIEREREREVFLLQLLSLLDLVEKLDEDSKNFHEILVLLQNFIFPLSFKGSLTNSRILPDKAKVL